MEICGNLSLVAILVSSGCGTQSCLEASLYQMIFFILLNMKGDVWACLLSSSVVCDENVFWCMDMWKMRKTFTSVAGK